MKIKMLVSMAGIDFVVNVGEETDRFGNDEAIRLIEAGYAEPVGNEEPEKATRKAREKR